MSRLDRSFEGSIAEVYDRDLVPMIFQAPADDLAARLASDPPARVLEVAAGTGVVTRALARCLPDATTLVATDLNLPMLLRARAHGTARPVEWGVADAMALPFADAAFDALACQFGAMFFPDRRIAFGEFRRVLAPGGRLLLSVWDRIEANAFADAVDHALAARFPQDPPRFIASVPHGVHDLDALRREFADAGFDRPVQVHALAFRSRAPSADQMAIAYCQGTPMRGEIEKRDATGLASVTSSVAAALARRFGPGPVEGRTRAFLFDLRR